MSFELILEFIVFFWLGALTVLLLTLNHCQKNQEALLYLLRDEINKYKRESGHIFCTGTDSDFKCNIPQKKGYKLTKKGDLQWQEKSGTELIKEQESKKSSAMENPIQSVREL